MLTTAQAAAMLGISDAHVRRLILTGKLPAVRFGGKVWIIDRRDLAKYRAPARGRPRKHQGDQK